MDSIQGIYEKLLITGKIITIGGSGNRRSMSSRSIKPKLKESRFDVLIVIQKSLLTETRKKTFELLFCLVCLNSVEWYLREKQDRSFLNIMHNLIFSELSASHCRFRKPPHSVSRFCTAILLDKLKTISRSILFTPNHRRTNTKLCHF